MLISTTSRYVLHARLLWRSAPVLSVLCLLLAIASSGAMTLAMFTSGRLIGALAGLVRDGGSGPAADRAWFWFAWTAAAFAAGPVLEALSEILTHRLSARYLTATFDMLLEIGTHPYRVDGFDDSRHSGRLTGLHQAMRDWTFVSGIDNTWVVLRRKLAGVGAVAITCTWHWWVAAALLLCHLLLSKVVTTWINSFFDDLLDVTGNARREATYIRKLLTGGQSGKEIRLFGLSDFLIDRFRTTWLAAMTLVWRNRTESLRPVVAILTLSTVVNAAAVGLLAHDAYAGAVSIAALATLIQAILGIGGFGPMGDPQSALARNTVAATELTTLRREVGLPELPDRHRTDTPEPLAAPAAGVAAGIELVDVAFTYPTRDEPTIQRLTLSIPPGQSVGIVGVNGAGKSTLIKLLSGLYAPDSGSVRIDGGDPATDARTRRRIAAIFQDFLRYHLPLRDNVGLGAGGVGIDDDLITAALSDAGADGLLERLDHGLDSVLSSEYADGTDLSGGQWQRVALARAFTALRAGAGVLVLDEPTAALDVRAEAALFDRFLEVTHGLTTLLVSHRLSSVRHADRIVVIGHGQDREGAVIEDGTHEQLMATGGEYAQMFTLQARRFAAAGTGSAEVVAP